MQISISSELIRCCVSSEVWMFLKLRLVVYASRIYPGVLTCNEGTCMLSGRYVSSALLRRSVAKLLNRSMPTSVPLIRKAINAMMANIVFDDFATGVLVLSFKPWMMVHRVRRNGCSILHSPDFGIFFGLFFSRALRLDISINSRLAIWYLSA